MLECPVKIVERVKVWHEGNSTIIYSCVESGLEHDEAILVLKTRKPSLLKPQKRTDQDKRDLLELLRYPNMYNKDQVKDYLNFSTSELELMSCIRCKLKSFMCMINRRFSKIYSCIKTGEVRDPS